MSSTTKKISNVTFLAFSVLMLVFVYYGIKNNLFASQSALMAFMNQFGVVAPIIFILFQVVQVVIPIIPGGISLVVGVVLFGPINGFIYNYIGILIGSIAAFLIAKRYGESAIDTIFGEKIKNKYVKYVNHKRFQTFFALAIFFPIAPDDFLCYLAGTTKMKLKNFFTIVALGKPMSIAVYSLGLGFIMSHLFLK